MWQTSTLKELVERARRAFRINLPGSDAWLWPNNINPTAKVVGGFTHEVLGFADYISRQKFALTADSENLDLHGEEFGLARRPAAPARGVATLSAAQAVTIDVGAIFRRGDGVEYRALVSGMLPDAGTIDIDVVATLDGKNTTAIAATSLEIVSGVTGDTLAVVGADGIAGGSDIEDDEAFRARILFRKRNPPHGGSAADYVLWASEVSGVSRVFVERLWNGTGTVRVFILMDDLYLNGLASGGDVARVADYIDTVKPSGAAVTVVAPTSVPVNITITGLTPDTIAVREAVLDELRGAFLRLSRPAGIDTPHGGMPFLAVPASFSRSWIWQAIANATGEERHVVTTPSADVSLSPGQIATLGSVTFAE